MNKSNIEQLQSILSYALSCGYTMDNKQDIEELSEFLDSKNVKVSGYNQIIYVGSRGCGKSLYIKTYLNNIKTKAIKELESKLIEQFKRLEHSPRTNRKTIRIEEVNAIVNTVLQEGVPQIIEKIVKEMLGENNENI